MSRQWHHVQKCQCGFLYCLFRARIVRFVTFRRTEQPVQGVTDFAVRYGDHIRRVDMVGRLSPLGGASGTRWSARRPAAQWGLEHTQQRLPQVLKPQTEYATFAYVEGGERPPIFLIQEGPLPSWSYRKRGLPDHQMGKVRWGMRAQQRSSPSGPNSCIS